MHPNDSMMNKRFNDFEIFYIIKITMHLLDINDFDIFF